MQSPASRSRLVRERCRELGFARAGICAAAPTAYPDELRRWLAESRHGEMSYMQQHVEVRLDPAALLAGARTIICVADRYDDGSAEPASTGHRGTIARYARGEDYHRVIKRRLHRLGDELRELFPGELFKACVDTAPLLEREHAQRAGLGSVGKHTLLIDRGIGSYLLLGALVTTLELDADAPSAPDPCGSCSRCVEACPTDAITPWTVDATRCISYLTIEHRGPIDASLHQPMQDWIFGCDICQEVCPHNQPTERARDAELHPAYAARRRDLDLVEVLRWSEDDRRKAFERSAMKRAKLPMMKRNALIAAGNALRSAPLPALRETIERLATDDREDEMVRATARDVLRALTSEAGGSH
jgi:epoxyqueuosine reductase